MALLSCCAGKGRAEAAVEKRRAPQPLRDPLGHIASGSIPRVVDMVVVHGCWWSQCTGPLAEVLVVGDQLCHPWPPPAPLRRRAASFFSRLDLRALTRLSSFAAGADGTARPKDRARLRSGPPPDLCKRGHYHTAGTSQIVMCKFQPSWAHHHAGAV